MKLIFLKLMSEMLVNLRPGYLKGEIYNFIFKLLGFILKKLMLFRNPLPMKTPTRKTHVDLYKFRFSAIICSVINSILFIFSIDCKLFLIRNIRQYSRKLYKFQDIQRMIYDHQSMHSQTDSFKVRTNRLTNNNNNNAYR